jgi:hypothetical protein
MDGLLRDADWDPDLHVRLRREGGKLTGKAKSSLSDEASEIQNGSVAGDEVRFVENLSFQGTDLAIDYAGKITGPDEIAFTRHVGDFATEELVAKRVKQ